MDEPDAPRDLAECADALPTGTANDGHTRESVSQVAASPASGTTPRWHRHPRALWRRSSDRVIVLPPDQAEPLLLEGTGAVIWDLLEDPTEERDLVTLLAQATGTDRSVIAPEVAAFLAQLAAEQVVRQP